MGLKFSDALRLSWSNIAEHKKRSVAIIVTISILFGAIMGFNFMLEGLREKRPRHLLLVFLSIDRCQEPP